MNTATTDTAQGDGARATTEHGDGADAFNEHSSSGGGLTFTADDGGEDIDAAELARRLDAAPEGERAELAFSPRVIAHAAALLDTEPAVYERLLYVVRAHGFATRWRNAVERAQREARAAAKRAKAERDAEDAARAREAREAERARDREAREARARERGEALAPFTAELELPGGITVATEPGSTVATIPGKSERAGPERLPLLNAAPRVVAVVAERAAPNATPERFVHYQFARAGGAISEVELRATDIATTPWMDAHALYVPSTERKARDLALNTLRELATRAPIVQRRAYLGWERTADGWMFVHAAGAIDAGGAVEGVDVRVRDTLAQFALPAPPSGAELREAALTVLAFAEAGGASGARVILPCLAATVRACLGPVEKGVTVWLSSAPGVGKSYLASLCARFYGPAFTPDAPAISYLPGRSSEPGAIKRLAAAGDVMAWADDARREGVKLASAIVQVHFNRAGDAKSRRDGSDRAEVRPRTTCMIVTGEALPMGHGERTRAVMVAMHGTPKRGDVPARFDAPGIGRFDGPASAGVFAATTAAMIRWHLQHLESRGESPEDMRRRDRAMAIAWGLNGDGREGERFGPLAAGLDTLCEWLSDVLPDAAARVEALRRRARDVLAALLAEQTAAVAEESPAARFVGILASALLSGAAHVAEVDARGARKAPSERASAWGWNPSGGDLKGAGDRIGLLLPTAPGAVVVDVAAAVKLAKRWTRDGDRSIDIDEERVGSMLYHAGALHTVELKDTGRRVRCDPANLRPLAEVKTGVRVGQQRGFLFVRAELLAGDSTLPYQHPDGSAEDPQGDPDGAPRGFTGHPDDGAEDP